MLTHTIFSCAAWSSMLGGVVVTVRVCVAQVDVTKLRKVAAIRGLVNDEVSLTPFLTPLGQRHTSSCSRKDVD